MLLQNLHHSPLFYNNKDIEFSDLSHPLHRFAIRGHWMTQAGEGHTGEELLQLATDTLRTRTRSFDGFGVA